MSCSHAKGLLVGYQNGGGDFCQASMSGAAKKMAGFSNEALGTNWVAAFATPVHRRRARVMVTNRLCCLSCFAVMVWFAASPAKNTPLGNTYSTQPTPCPR